MVKNWGTYKNTKRDQEPSKFFETKMKKIFYVFVEKKIRKKEGKNKTKNPNKTKKNKNKVENNNNKRKTKTKTTKKMPKINVNS